MKIEDHFLLIELFEIYGCLFTKKQCKYFYSSYFEDKSLSEISSENNVSRTAVFNSIKYIISELKRYENLLNLYKKKNKRFALYNDINDTKLKEKFLLLERDNNEKWNY